MAGVPTCARCSSCLEVKRRLSHSHLFSPCKNAIPVLFISSTKSTLSWIPTIAAQLQVGKLFRVLLLSRQTPFCVDVIRTISDEAQFITSTFHPEMIEVADKVFGVYSRNKVSSISEWDKEGALEFVSSEAQ